MIILAVLRDVVHSTYMHMYFACNMLGYETNNNQGGYKFSYLMCRIG